MLSIQNWVIKLTQTSIWNLKGKNSKNLLCVWHTNGCAQFPMLRLAWFAFLEMKCQLVSDTQDITHDASNRRKQPDYEEHYGEDDDIEGTNPIGWISGVSR